MQKELTKQNILDWLMRATGDFHISALYKDLNIITEDARAKARVYLGRIEKEEKIVKHTGRHDGMYRKVTGLPEPIKFLDVDPDAKLLDVRFPRGYPWGDYEASSFDLDGRIKVFPGDIIALAGVSNKGKTAWALNFIFENMDNFECLYFTNELNDMKLFDRVRRHGVDNLRRPDGTPKFNAYPCTKDWQDVVVPGAINVLDYINLQGEFYDVDRLYTEMKERMGGSGLVLAILQKGEGKELGRGGSFGVEQSSYYFMIDPGRINYHKVKAMRNGYPNLQGKTYGFDLVDEGNKFTHIREVEICRKCKGYGKIGGANCLACYAQGYTDKESVYDEEIPQDYP